MMHANYSTKPDGPVAGIRFRYGQIWSPWRGKDGSDGTNKVDLVELPKEDMQIAQVRGKGRGTLCT